MKIIQRYLLTEFLRHLGLVLLTFILVFLLVDFLEKIDNFLEAGVRLPRVLYYYLLLIPSVVFNLAPVAVLVSVMITVGLMARRSELVALKASGVSLFTISLPFVLTALAVCLMLFGLSESVIPYTSVKTNAIWNVEVEKKQDASTGRYKNVWFKSGGMIGNFQVYDRPGQKLAGIGLYRFDPGFHLTERVEAKEGRMIGGRWEFDRGLVKSFEKGGRFVVQPFQQEFFDLPALPEDVSRVTRAPEEMSFEGLKAYARRVRAEGHDPIRSYVNLHMKLAFPFISLVMVLLGLPIAFWREKGGGIPLGIGAGIGLSFIYLVFLGLARSMGYIGFLPPMVAAWLPSVFFILLGLFMFTLVRF
jgi:lipopolysaccharide export system permease protein